MRIDAIHVVQVIGQRSSVKRRVHLVQLTHVSAAAMNRPNAFMARAYAAFGSSVGGCCPGASDRVSLDKVAPRVAEAKREVALSSFGGLRPILTADP
jgi:hypothetical protein